MEGLSSFKSRVGFLGAGNMASSLIRGTVSSGLPPEQVTATDLVTDKTSRLSKELSITAKATAEELVRDADLIVVAVKPSSVSSTLAPLRSLASERMWISVAAGITTETLEDILGEVRVIRAMPNTPALVGMGATGLCAGRFATESDLRMAETLLGTVGITQRLTETQMDALTGLSGSGPAYLMLAIEAMADAAVSAGLPRDVALRFAAQTVQGAGALALTTGKHPAELKDQVTSPAGTTIAGVHALEKGRFRATLMAAVLASVARSQELSNK